MWARVVAVLAVTLCAAVLTHAWSATSSDGVTVTVDEATGALSVHVDDAEWFHSSFTAFHVNQRWYSVTSQGKPLYGNHALLQHVYTNTSATECRLRWLAGSINYETAVSVSDADVVFEQYFVDGGNLTAIGRPDKYEQVLSSFPSIEVSSGRLPLLRYTTLQGMWDVGTIGQGLHGFSGARDGGVPLVLIDDASLRTVVLSPLGHYQSTYFVVSTMLGQGYLLMGVAGGVEVVLPQTRVRVLLHSGHGVNSTVYGWGERLLAESGKTRRDTDDAASLPSRFLGYYTDNGAYYYYHMLTNLPNSTYEDTMKAVRDSLAAQQLPVAYYQLDSWWYFKGPRGGVSNWDARPDVFPSGMAAVSAMLGKPLVLHNRWWSNQNIYVDKYFFYVEPLEAVPNDSAFFDFLLGRAAKEWNVAVYEQDWLINQFEFMNATQNNMFVAERWLGDMGDSAESLGMSIQYCMPLPMHYLASTEHQAVAEIRVSDDYQPGRPQWRIGRTSMFAWALGLSPFKDVFWTTGVQPGNPYNTSEPNYQLQAAVAALSRGPVAFGDGINLTDSGLLMRALMQDGRILRASKPATAIDRTYTTRAPPVDVWESHSDIGGGFRSHAVLVAGITSDPFDVTADDVAFPSGAQGVVFETPLARESSKTTVFSASQPLHVPAMTPHKLQTPFHVYSIVPVLSNGWAFLGESDKWLSVSTTRFTGIQASPAGLVVVFEGAPHEPVSLAVRDASGNVVWTDCIVSAGGVSKLSCGAGVHCSCV